MRGLRLTSTGPPPQLPIADEVHGRHAWRDSLAPLGVVMVGFVAVAFVLIVLPWLM